MRKPIVVQGQFIESSTTRLASDMLMDCLNSVFLKSQAVVYRLTDRFYAEARPGVADGEPLAVHGADSDSQLVRVNPGELGYVIRHRTALVVPHRGVYFRNFIAEGGKVRDD
jgi:hypothetical protein